jgi:hypothetical protein
MWAIAKTGFQWGAAPRTHVPSLVREGNSPHGLIGRGYRPASITYHHRLSPFDRKKRNKKQTQIVIHTLQTSLSQSTLRTQSRYILHRDRPGLNAAYEEEHVDPLPRLSPLGADIYHNPAEINIKTPNSFGHAPPARGCAPWSRKHPTAESAEHAERSDGSHDHHPPRPLGLRGEKRGSSS